MTAANSAKQSIEIGMIIGIGFAVIGLVLGFVVNILTPINVDAAEGVNAILQIYFSAPVIAIVTGVVLLTLLGAVAPAIKPLWNMISGGGKKGGYD